MESIGHATIGLLHLGDLREHVAFSDRLTRKSAPPLFEGLFHRGSFFVREQVGPSRLRAPARLFVTHVSSSFAQASQLDGSDVRTGFSGGLSMAHSEPGSGSAAQVTVDAQMVSPNLRDPLVLALRESPLLVPGVRLLVAVSGGPDST